MNNNQMKVNYKILLIFKIISNKKSTIITLKTINKNFLDLFFSVGL